MPECQPGTHSMFDFCPGDCTAPVSVRDRLTDLLSHTSDAVLDEMFPEELSFDDIAGQLLADHAHEVAEQIRAQKRTLVGYSEWLDGMDDAADLIDPKVS